MKIETIFVIQDIFRLSKDDRKRKARARESKMAAEEEEEDTDPTESTVLQIKFVAYSVIAYIIVGIGIVGNLLNLVVLTRPNLKGVMYVYLLGLAVSNLCVLLSAVPALFDIAGGGLAGAGAYPTAFYQVKS